MTGQKYYLCSVSTCQSKVTNYAFCSVGCWDAHVPMERHRPDGAGALERVAPKSLAGAEAQPSAPAAKAVIASSKPLGDDEVLVVVSKVRKYISDQSGLNTSAEVYDTLSEKIKRLCDRAIEESRAHGRKTVMSRDFV